MFSALAKIELRGGPQDRMWYVRVTGKMYEYEREKKSVLGEANGVDDSGFVRWTKIYFSPIELWKDRAGREKE